MNHCVRHFEEPMAGSCRACHAPFCGRCLVFAFGPKKPPFCIGCALNAGGVRNSYKAAPMVQPVESSADRRAQKAAAKAEAKAAKAASKGRRGRGGQYVEPAAAGSAPIPFEAGWAEPPAPEQVEEAERDVRVPATAQLAKLMRSRAGAPVGQPI